MKRPFARTGIRLWAAMAVVAIGLAVATAGCASNSSLRTAASRSVVVFCEPITEQDLATASSEFVERAQVRPAERRRDGAEMTCYYTQPCVQHYPLWWEDPFEDKDKISGNGYAGLTWEDFLAIFYGDGRWLANTILAPVSMVVTPPWRTMRSNGVLSKQLLGYDHDAQPAEPVLDPYDLRQRRQLPPEQ